MTENDDLGLLQVRKLSDRSEGRRVARRHPLTGDTILLDPGVHDPDDISKVAEWEHKPWPLAGIEFVEKPTRCFVPTSWVARAKAEGWLSVEGERPVHRPGGPPEDLWRSTHTFIHLDAIVIHANEGDVRYVVTRQPDKYVDTRPVEPDAKGVDVIPTGPGPDDDVAMTDEHYAAGETRVDWTYELRLED